MQETYTLRVINMFPTHPELRRNLFHQERQHVLLLSREPVLVRIEKYAREPET